jgi:hypothetical protein
LYLIDDINDVEGNDGQKNQRHNTNLKSSFHCFRHRNTADQGLAIPNRPALLLENNKDGPRINCGARTYLLTVPAVESRQDRRTNSVTTRPRWQNKLASNPRAEPLRDLWLAFVFVREHDDDSLQCRVWPRYQWSQLFVRDLFGLASRAART